MELLEGMELKAPLIRGVGGFAPRTLSPPKGRSGTDLRPTAGKINLSSVEMKFTADDRGLRGIVPTRTRQHPSSLSLSK